MRCVYGTIDFEETTELEEFSPYRKLLIFEKCASSPKDLGSKRIRQTLLRKRCLFQF